MCGGRLILILNYAIEAHGVHPLGFYLKAANNLFIDIFKAADHCSQLFILCLMSLIVCSRIRNQKLTVGFLFIFLFTSSYPPIGTAINIGLDPSWMYALNYFFFKHMQFGKDVLYTYGPLGFLGSPQPLGNNLLFGICFNLGAYALLVFSIVCLLMPILKGKRPLIMALYTIFSYWILTKCNNNLAYIPALLIPVLLLNYDAGGKPVFLFLAAAAVSALFLIKMGWGIVGLSFLASYLILKLIIERKYRLFFGLFSFIIVLFFAFWVLIYHNFNGLQGYIVSSFQFLQGHNSAMSIDPGNDDSVLYFLNVLFIIALFAWALKGKKIVVITFIFVLPLAITFKYAFGRQDVWHTLEFITFLLFYFFAVMIQKSAVGKKIIVGVIFLLTLLSFFTLKNTPNFIAWSLDFGYKKGIKNLYNSSFGYHAWKRKLLHTSEQTLEKEVLPKGIVDEIKQQPVDVYPWDSTYIAANNLHWRSRPVFQSTAAYTPYLDGANCNFFKGTDAPKYIVWVKEGWGGAMNSIDGRYLLNDEPETVYAIINEYEPIRSEQDAVLLRRKEKPTFQEPFGWHSENFKWNQWIDVPVLRDSVIRAKINFKRTLYGKIKRVLWKEKEVKISYRFKNGFAIKYRLVVDNAISGVWIHPYITGIGASVQYGNVHNLFSGATVVQIKFSYNDKDIFEPQFNIVWEASRLNR
jgi:hypothetical protein